MKNNIIISFEKNRINTIKYTNEPLLKERRLLEVFPYVVNLLKDMDCCNEILNAGFNKRMFIDNYEIPVKSFYLFKYNNLFTLKISL